MTEKPAWQGEFGEPGPNPMGPTVWFLVGPEPIEIKLVDIQPQTALAAATTLGSRFLFRRTATGGWACYDTRAFFSDRPAVWPAPTKMFDTAPLDVPVMWALARSAGEM